MLLKSSKCVSSTFGIRVYKKEILSAVFLTLPLNLNELSNWSNYSIEQWEKEKPCVAKRKKSLFPLKGLMAGRSSFRSRDSLSAADRSSTWQTPSLQERINKANLCCTDRHPPFSLSAQPLHRCLPHHCPFSPTPTPLPPRPLPLHHLIFDPDDLFSVKHVFMT